MAKFSRRLGYEDFFSESDSIDSLLQGFTKDDLFRVSSLLNSKARQNQNAIMTILDWFSSPQQKKYLTKRVTNDKSHIINVYSNLTLLSLISQCQSSRNSERVEDFELNLFKIYLLINSNQNKIESENFPKIDSLDLPEKLSALLLQMCYHSNDLNSYALQEIFLCQIIKSVEFFKYLGINLNRHLELFLQRYNCVSWQEWIKTLLNIIVPVIAHDNTTFSEIKLDERDIHKIGNFLYLFSRKIETEEKPDFIELRSRPLYKINPSTYIVINKLFLIERIFKSLIFEFSLEINEKIDDEWKVKDFRAEFCNNFSEETLFYKMISCSFPNNSKYKKISGVDFKNKGYKIGEPDYYVRFKNKILLFESKDVVLTGCFSPLNSRT